MSRAGSILVVAAAAMSGLAITTTAVGAGSSVATVEPATRVHGMLVVAAPAHRADRALFGDLCDPVVLAAGRRVRTCGRLPHVTRLFVGHGWFAPKQALDRQWKRLTWELWVDGQRVDLEAFGWADRWLYRFPPAGGRDVVLREWSVTLVRPVGRHAVRYRTRAPSGVTDTTWKFTVAPR